MESVEYLFHEIKIGNWFWYHGKGWKKIGDNYAESDSDVVAFDFDSVVLVF